METRVPLFVPFFGHGGGSQDLNSHWSWHRKRGKEYKEKNKDEEKKLAYFSSLAKQAILLKRRAVFLYCHHPVEKTKRKGKKEIPSLNQELDFFFLFCCYKEGGT